MHNRFHRNYNWRFFIIIIITIIAIYGSFQYIENGFIDRGAHINLIGPQAARPPVLLPSNVGNESEMLNNQI